MPLSRTAEIEPFPRDAFADVLAGNATHVAAYQGSTLPAVAARGLAVVTCMDSRIVPLSILGMAPGDVTILRNAGARVTEDVLRTIVLATYLLGVNRVLVMPHTGCKMAGGDEAAVHAAIRAEHGVDTRSVEIRTVSDQRSALITDVVRIRSWPLHPAGLVVAGALYDLATGVLEPVDC